MSEHPPQNDTTDEAAEQILLRFANDDEGRDIVAQQLVELATFPPPAYGYILLAQLPASPHSRLGVPAADGEAAAKDDPESAPRIIGVVLPDLEVLTEGGALTYDHLETGGDVALQTVIERMFSSPQVVTQLAGLMCDFSYAIFVLRSHSALPEQAEGSHVVRGALYSPMTSEESRALGATEEQATMRMEGPVGVPSGMDPTASPEPPVRPISVVRPLKDS